MKKSELYAGLTPTQERRVDLKIKGLTQVEIANIEGCCQSAISVSFKLARRKMLRNIEALKHPPRPNTFDYSIMRIKSHGARRLKMVKNGLEIADIAKIEGVTWAAVRLSIKIEKKLQKHFKKANK